MDAFTQGARLLVVEDDPDIRAGLADLFAAEGFGVAEASNGEEGLAVARAERAELIVLDLMMPVMDGFLFLEHRAADAVLARVPVIVLTARRPVEVPGCEIVYKPFDLDALLRTVRRLLRPDVALGAPG